MDKFIKDTAVRLKNLIYAGKADEFLHMLDTLRNLLQPNDYLTILYTYDKLVENDYKRHNGTVFEEV